MRWIVGGGAMTKEAASANPMANVFQGQAPACDTIVSVLKNHSCEIDSTQGYKQSKRAT